MHKVCLFALAIVLAATASIAQTDDRLRIGVRSDARPFSYRSAHNVDVLTAATPGPLAKRKYTGFMVKICDAVLTNMLINPVDKSDPFTEQDIVIVDVDALVAQNPEGSRFDYFGTLPPNGPARLTGDKFDILCDPATITNERRSGLILSPPLFLSGISFIDRPDVTKPPQPARNECPSHPIFGLVGNTTAAQSGIRAILAADELPRYRSLLIDFLNERPSTCAKGPQNYSAVKVYAGHTQAAKAFCQDDPEFYYYLGDQEIISANARMNPGCEFENAGRTFTTDRYAIFGKLNYDTPNRALHVARFFEILSQKVPFSPSILDTAFSDTFIADKSRALELFFWSIRGPQ
ncbi:type 2 periplasmic-binding domain-containing protein [Sedimentitalea nanhaiensis]|uniref:Extracellular solute-binding protein, family 3 n=1 Tax=Sedimentitalea nanhaiensis TaxID=999627 RepID=A0A1I6YKK4_9RHOB|nr:hypothetical protein [Sedimentitalea nanhaiensis]SFT50897.1 hypothetical protein SAMN05216236_102264 [Sedimentitalea nanhaiensis]